MIAALVFAVLTVPAPKMPSPGAQLIEIFKSACFDGQVKLQSNEKDPLQLNLIPSALAKAYGTFSALRVYKLGAAPDSFLILFDGDSTINSPKHGCAVASRSVNHHILWETLNNHPTYANLNASHVALQSTYERRLIPESGAEIEAQKIGDGYSILQLTMLNNEQMKLAVEEQSRIDRVIGSSQGQTLKDRQ